MEHRRVIVIFPRCAGLARIEQVRTRFDPLAAYVPAHITLVFPFRSPLTTAALHAHIEQVLAPMRPFPVLLGEVTGHTEEYLFLNVKRGNDELIRLHDHLYGGILAPYYEPVFTYTPHLTVGRIADEGAFYTALGTARTLLSQQFDIVVDRVSVYRVGAHGDRPIELEVPLRA